MRTLLLLACTCAIGPSIGGTLARAQAALPQETREVKWGAAGIASDSTVLQGRRALQLTAEGIRVSVAVSRSPDFTHIHVLVRDLNGEAVVVRATEATLRVVAPKPRILRLQTEDDLIRKTLGGRGFSASGSGATIEEARANASANADREGRARADTLNSLLRRRLVADTLGAARTVTAGELFFEREPRATNLRFALPTSRGVFVFPLSVEADRR